MSTTQIDLPIARTVSAQQPRLDPRERDRLIRRAKALSWLSLAYMTAEGAIAITAALLAGSVALLGFGLDSAIEALASVIVIWRFTGTRRLSQDAERHAQRLVAISFFLLAPYIAQDAIRTLINGEHPHTSWLGIGLSISSIIVMPQLANAKHRIGQRLGSGATTGEGTQNLLCAYLAAGVLDKPRAQRRPRPLVGRSHRRSRYRRPRDQRRPPNLARRQLLHRPPDRHQQHRRLRRRLLSLIRLDLPDPHRATKPEDHDQTEQDAPPPPTITRASLTSSDIQTSHRRKSRQSSNARKAWHARFACATGSQHRRRSHALFGRSPAVIPAASASLLVPEAERQLTVDRRGANTPLGAPHSSKRNAAPGLDEFRESDEGRSFGALTVPQLVRSESLGSADQTLGSSRIASEQY